MIRVKSVEISRFRGIKEGAVRGFADVNVLVGRNNCGKSTVMEAIHRVASSGSDRPADALGRAGSSWMTTRGETQAYPPELWYALDQSEPVTITTQVGKPDAPSSGQLSWSLVFRGGTSEGDSVWTWTDQSGASRKEIVEWLGRATVFFPEDARNRTIEQHLWERIIGSRHDKTLTESLNTIFSQNAEGCTFLNNRVWWLFSRYSVPLDSQGEGGRAALRCLLLLTLLRQALFIAEEPECHQHPGSLKGFAEALCRQAREQEVQLFLSTHSAECLRAFLEAARKASLRGRGLPSDVERRYPGGNAAPARIGGNPD